MRIKSINLSERKLFGVLTGSRDRRTCVANALLEGTEEWVKAYVARRTDDQQQVYRTDNGRIKLSFFGEDGREMAAYLSEDKLLGVISGDLPHKTLVGHLRDEDSDSWYRLYVGTYQDGRLYRTRKYGDLKLNLRGEDNKEDYQGVWQD